MNPSVNTWALLSALAIFILLGTSIPGALLSMIISGTVPGTTYTPPLWFTLTAYPIISLLAVFWITRHTMYIGEINKPVKVTTVKQTKTQRVKKKVSKQTALKRRARTTA